MSLEAVFTPLGLSVEGSNESLESEDGIAYPTPITSPNLLLQTIKELDLGGTVSGRTISLQVDRYSYSWKQMDEGTFCLITPLNVPRKFAMNHRESVMKRYMSLLQAVTAKNLIARAEARGYTVVNQGLNSTGEIQLLIRTDS